MFLSQSLMGTPEIKKTGVVLIRESLNNDVLKPVSQDKMDLCVWVWI